MTITSIVGTILGASATKKVDPGKIKIFFAITLFLGGISVLFKQLRFDLMSNVSVFGIAGVSTLLITVGLLWRPETTGKGGFVRG